MESLGAIRWRVRPSSSNYELQTLSDCRVRVPVPHFCVARINVFEISRLVTSLVTVNGNTVGEGMGSNWAILQLEVVGMGQRDGFCVVVGRLSCFNEKSTSTLLRCLSSRRVSESTGSYSDSSSN